MKPIHVVDRITGHVFEEKVYGGEAVEFLYGHRFLSRTLGRLLVFLSAKQALFSRFYGWLQKRPCSKKKVEPFVKAYNVDATEFLLPISAYTSFNDFFIRQLKPDARPIATAERTAIIPADGRYRFFQNIDEVDGFIVKGQKFDLAAFIGDEQLAANYAGGTMVMARLCPVDYHRFHFPVACCPSASRLINGYLYSVNPIALRENIDIYSENKRMMTILHSSLFGDVLFAEIGATNVGSIHQTYKPNEEVPKGGEKGYFSFGGSALIVLFKRGTIRLDADLVELSHSGLEVRCLMGQSLGVSPAC